jgi:hypothetical protein
MAYDSKAGAVDLSLIASGDLSSSQYRFVQLSADNTVVICTGITDVPVGVLQNKPTSGQAATVRCAGISKLECGASLSAGDIVATATDAQAQVAVSTQHVAGQIIEGAAADEVGTASISCLAPSIKA